MSRPCYSTFRGLRRAYVILTRGAPNQRLDQKAVVASEILLIEDAVGFKDSLKPPHRFDRQIDRKENLKNAPSEFFW